MSLKYKPLPSQKRLLELLDYNQLTGDLWRKDLGKPAFTAKTKKGYRIGSIDNVLYRANRIIYKLMTGIDPEQVDHENGIRDDDRWINLKNVTAHQNSKNMETPVNNTSGHVGVIFKKDKNKWSAYIGGNNNKIYLGYYTSFEDAVVARKQAEIENNYHPNHGR